MEEDFVAANSPKLFKAAEKDNVKDIERILAAAPTLEIKKRLINALDDTSGFGALHVACLNDCYDTVRLLVEEQGCDVNLQDRNKGNTALHLVIKSNNTSMDRILRNANGIERNIQNKRGQTPFHILIKSKVTTVQNYLKQDFSPAIKDNDGHTPFHIAIVRDLLEKAEAFLEFDKGIADQTTGNGETPLWLALKNNQQEMFELLLQKGANVNATHELFGTTVLWLAVDLQQEWAVDIVLDSPDFNSDSIFDFGREDSSPFILSLVRKNESIRDKLAKKADLKTKILFCLMSKSKMTKVDPFWTDEDRNSLLHLAVMSDSPEVVQDIKLFCPDIGQKNKDGKTPRDLAMERGFSQVVKLFNIGNESCSGPAMDKLRQVAELSKMFPVFVEQEQQDWFQQIPNLRNDISINDMEQHIIGQLNIDWNSSPGESSSHLQSLAERQLHFPKSNDDPSTILAKSILKVMLDVEHYLNNKHELFRYLDVSFLPVGSIVEGTKVGPLDEMDFMVAFSKLDEKLTIRDEHSLVIENEDLQMLPDELVKGLFGTDGRLDLLQLFLKFVHAVGEAVDSLVDMPANLSKNKMQCGHPECWDNSYVIPVKKQCSVMFATPCVCFTKVGVGLNFIVQNGEEKNVFTVDLVMIFQPMYNSNHIANDAELRQLLVKNLLEDHPPGWRAFLTSYVGGDRAGLEQFAEAENGNKAFVCMKMIGFTGNFVLRPGLNLKANKMFNNKHIRKAYNVLKLIRYLADSKVKSYELKKVMFSLKQHLTALEGNIYEIVKTVLQHKEMQGKFESIRMQFSERMSRIDLVDFPKTIDGESYLHFVANIAEQLKHEITAGKITDGFTSLAESIDDEACSIQGSSPLHWATERPVKPSLTLIKDLTARGCCLNKIDLSKRSAVHLLICNSQTTKKCLEYVLSRVPNMKPTLVYYALVEGLKYLNEDDNSCGRERDEQRNNVIMSNLASLATSIF